MCEAEPEKPHAVVRKMVFEGKETARTTPTDLAALREGSVEKLSEGFRWPLFKDTDRAGTAIPCDETPFLRVFRYMLRLPLQTGIAMLFIETPLFRGFRYIE
jgi:hypothetical protein